MQRLASGKESFSVNLNDEDLDELDKLAQATKGQDPNIKKAGYTAILNDVLHRTDTAIDMQKDSQAYIQTSVKYASSIVFVMALLLIANFALTISAIEMSKESHVKSSAMTDTGGKILQVGSSDFTLGSGGEIVQRASASTAASVGTAPVLSKYKLSSRTPNKYLEELDAFTVTRPCAKGAKNCNSSPTMKVTVKSFKRQPSEGSHCGSVVVFQTDMGEFTLDDDNLYQGESKMSAAEGLFSLGDRRLANMNISSYGRRLMEDGAAPAVDASVHGAFNFLGNINADDFVCEMGGIIGKKFTVDPPKAPVMPYAYVVRKESVCKFENIDACESDLTQGLKPGVTQHANFTTMRTYEQVLLTRTHRVVVSYFATQPLSRLIQIIQIEAQVYTQYINFRQNRAKLNCMVKPVEGGKKATEMAVHLAYLSTAVDEGHPSMRWALSQYNAQGSISSNYMEYWERVGTRKPRRVFQHGSNVIAEGVSVHFFMTPLEWVEFSPGLTDEEVAQWLTSVLFLGRAEAIDAAAQCPAEIPKGTMPVYLGPYGEAAARWTAPQLQEGDLQQFGPSILWTSSYYKYWNAVVASLGTPSIIGSTVPSSGRRLSDSRPRDSSGVYAQDPVRASDPNDEYNQGQAANKMAKANFPKSTADMKEFADCFNTVKDCLQGKQDGLCMQFFNEAIGSIGGTGEFGSVTMFKIELSCGPCTIGITDFESIPSFACIFEGGSGCFWKPAGGVVKLFSDDLGFWEKWTEEKDMQTDFTDCLKSELILESGNDWIYFMCPDFTRVLGGGCNAKENRRIMQTSSPHGADENGWRCGGHGGEKEGKVICSGRMESRVVWGEGGDWKNAFCQSNERVSGGGCHVKNSPHIFQFNAAVHDRGWRCGGHGGEKITYAVCVSSNAGVTRHYKRNNDHEHRHSCPNGKKLTGGGCDAYQGSRKIQISWPETRSMWKCSGHANRKQTWILCVTASLMEGVEKCTCPKRMVFVVTTDESADVLSELCTDGPTQLEFVGRACTTGGTRIEWTSVSKIISVDTSVDEGTWSVVNLQVTQGSFSYTSGSGVVLVNGGLQFHDRGYVLSGIPQQLIGVQFYRGPCHSEVVRMTVSVTTNARVYVLVSKGDGDVMTLSSNLIANGFKRTPIDLLHMTTGSFPNEVGFYGWEIDVLTGGSVQIYTTRNHEITIAYLVHLDGWVLPVPPPMPTLTVRQGKFSYVTGDNIIMGEDVRQFNDRDFMFRDVPEELVYKPFFQGPCNSGVVQLTLTTPIAMTLYVLASKKHGGINAFASSLREVGFVGSTYEGLNTMKTVWGGRRRRTPIGFWGWQKDMAAGETVSVATGRNRRIIIVFTAQAVGRRLSGALPANKMLQAVGRRLSGAQRDTAYGGATNSQAPPPTPRPPTMVEEQINCAWTRNVQSSAWVNKYLGHCGVAPLHLPQLPSDCGACPHVVKYTTSSNASNLCGHSAFDSRMEFTGVQCGGYLRDTIQWDTLRNLDPKPGFTTSQCSWDRTQTRRLSGDGRRLSGAVGGDIADKGARSGYDDIDATYFDELQAQQEATVGNQAWKKAYFGECGAQPKYFKMLPIKCSELTTAVAISRRLSGAVGGSGGREQNDRRRTLRRRTLYPTPHPTPLPTSGWTQIKSFLQAHSGEYLEVDSSDENFVKASAGKGKAKTWTQISVDGDKVYLQSSMNGKKLGDHNGHVSLSDGGSNDWKKWTKIHAGMARGLHKWFFKSHRGWYLSAPGGEYGCKICLSIDMTAAGMEITICVGFDNGCWVYVSVMGVRVPPPQWARMTGVTITLAGFIKVCFVPVKVHGWVKLQVSRGFCVGAWWTLGMVLTFSIYGYLKFEMEWADNSVGATFRGMAAIGVSGGIYAPDIMWFNGRRRTKCKCDRVRADGELSSCPRKASANAQVTFTLKLWPCQKGVDATLEGSIRFTLALSLFGIDISLPKIPDILLFSTAVRKPFGPE